MQGIHINSVIILTSCGDWLARFCGTRLSLLPCTDVVKTVLWFATSPFVSTGFSIVLLLCKGVKLVVLIGTVTILLSGSFRTWCVTFWFVVCKISWIWLEAYWTKGSSFPFGTSQGPPRKKFKLLRWIWSKILIATEGEMLLLCY